MIEFLVFYARRLVESDFCRSKSEEFSTAFVVRASRVNYSRGTRCSATQASLERAKGSSFVIERVKKRVGRGVLFDTALI